MLRRFLAVVLLCTSVTLHAETISLSGSNIVRVYDGDTFYINLPNEPEVFGKNIGVRVLGVDTPEMRSGCDDPAHKEREKLLAKQAKAVLSSHLEPATVIELRDVKRDKYFRLLADVYVDGSQVSQLLIDEGLAVPYDGGTKIGWCGK